MNLLSETGPTKTTNLQTAGASASAVGDILDHVIGVGGGAAGDEPAQGAVDQRREVRPEVSNPAQTLYAAMRRAMDTGTHRVHFELV